MLLTISTHHYVELYSPIDDPKSGEWTLCLDLTKNIEELSKSDSICLDQLQSTCIYFPSFNRYRYRMVLNVAI